MLSGNKAEELRLSYWKGAGYGKKQIAAKESKLQADRNQKLRAGAEGSDDTKALFQQQP